MRAKSVKFEKHTNPRHSLYKTEREKILELLNDIEGRSDWETVLEFGGGFLSFLSLIPEDFDDPEKAETFRILLKNYNRYLEDMKDLGLFIFQPPDLEEEELGFYDRPSIGKGKNRHFAINF